MKFLLLLTALLFNSPAIYANDAENTSAAFAPSATVQLTVEGILTAKGLVQVEVYQAEGFSTVHGRPSGDLFKAYSFKVNSFTPEFTLQLPEGRYVIAVYHDENENGKLDTTLLGLPRELSGLSAAQHRASNPIKKVVGSKESNSAIELQQGYMPLLIALDKKAK